MTRMAKWIIAVVLGIGVAQVQTITVLHAFTGADGANPAGGLLRDPSGNFYGSTGWGGAYGWGTIFKVDTNNVETVLYSFTPPACFLISRGIFMAPSLDAMATATAPERFSRWTPLGNRPFCTPSLAGETVMVPRLVWSGTTPAICTALPLTAGM